LTCCFVRDNEKRQYRMDFLISDDGEKEIDSETVEYVCFLED
jgi:hypothetical protein